MGKLDVGVGDEFPVDEPVPPSPGTEEATCAADEEWQSQKEEWRQRRNEWHAQRDAWKADLRARRDAFKADMRNSFQEHFGSRARLGFNPILMSGAAAIGFVVLMIALLPLALLLVPVAMGILVFLAVRHHHDHHHATGAPPTQPK
jgi:Flp pilus assembly protein TadB